MIVRLCTFQSLVAIKECRSSIIAVTFKSQVGVLRQHVLRGEISEERYALYERILMEMKPLKVVVVI